MSEQFVPHDLLPTELLVQTLHAACVAAAVETLPRFRANTTVSNKQQAGFDPVTEADQAAETAIISVIQDAFPDHGIVGEEHGARASNADWQWIIDPIDGTRAFISGLPVWGTLIGLYWRGVPFAGVLDQPFTQERFMAYTDATCMRVSELSVRGNTVAPNKTRTTTDLADAIMMTTSPRIFNAKDGARYDALEPKVKLPRYGCDCYAYGMLAAGQIDLVVESGLHIYDIAAIIPIVRNAGGVVTNWQGEDPSKGGSVLAAANESLHEKALAVLKG